MISKFRLLKDFGNRFHIFYHFHNFYSLKQVWTSIFWVHSLHHKPSVVIEVKSKPNLNKKKNISTNMHYLVSSFVRVPTNLCNILIISRKIPDFFWVVSSANKTMLAPSKQASKQASGWARYLLTTCRPRQCLPKPCGSCTYIMIRENVRVFWSLVTVGLSI